MGRIGLRDMAQDQEAEGFDRLSTGAEMLISAGAAAIGYVGGPATAAIAAASASLALRTFQWELRRHRAEHLAREVFSGLAPQQLIERIRDTPRLADLVEETVAAAIRTDLQNKRTALGRSLRRGILANDDATIDQEAVLIRTLAAIDAPEIRILEIISRSKGKPRPLSERGREGALDLDEITSELVGSNKTADEAMRTAQTAQGILGLLAAQGLVQDTGATTGTTFTGGLTPSAWRLTVFGSSLLRWLEEAEETT